jgi:hypothetical protein
VRRGEDYKSFYLKKGTWDAIRCSRGWGGRGEVARFAEAINITRQYAAEIVKGNIGCSTNVISKIVTLLGIKDECWCHLFERHREVEMPLNHPLYNHLKHIGEVPYAQDSHSALFRSKDYPAETMGHSNE